MNTDLYTKIILTIVAIVLTANLIKGSITPAMADTKRYLSVPLNTDGSLNVNIMKTNYPLEVNIRDISYQVFNRVEPLQVKIK
ncbi:hypothetical protein [Mucilaginibacter sp. CSA2-8R]|uniref:hypothetical protein n=1 Tax=Mucilaginibacter sp. CSA2-8R TaxID=3141542 RepID=UPI00315D5C94